MLFDNGFTILKKLFKVGNKRNYKNFRLKDKEYLLTSVKSVYCIFFVRDIH